MKMFLYSVSLLSFLYVSSAKANFEMTFNLGPSLSQSENIDDLGDPSLSTGFGFNYFFNQNHGIGLGYNSESSYDGSKKFPGIKEASFSTFDLHYAYRYVKDRFQVVFEPGIGTQTLYDEGTDYYWGYVYNDDISSALAVNYKIFLRYVLADLSGQDNWTGNNFFIGTGLVHNFTFDDSLNGKDISGNRLSAVFQLGLSF
jgi:hypothetical protein